MKKAVLAGCGVMGARWAAALSASPLRERIELVALVDVNRNVAESVKQANGLSGAIVATDLDSALGQVTADVVFDVAVPAARKDLVLTAFAHGCDVLTEKPMAASMSDAAAILAASKELGRLHAVTQNRRFKRSIRRIRTFLASGAIGEISAMHCDFFIGAHFGGFRDVMEHVLLLDMAIHTFDAARFMSGKDALAVYCLETNPKGSWYAHGAAANAIFEMTDAVTFTYRGSWAAEGANTSWEAAWRIIGAKGTLLWDGEDEISAHVVDGDDGFFRPLRAVPIPEWSDPSVTNEHVSAIEDFLDALEGRGTPESVGTDNINSLAMVFAAIESARRRQLVPVEEAIRCIVLDLYVSSRLTPDCEIGVSLGKGAFVAGSRYAALFLSFDTFRPAFGGLEALGYVPHQLIDKTTFAQARRTYHPYGLAGLSHVINNSLSSLRCG